jgi:hypothetical protein
MQHCVRLSLMYSCIFVEGSFGPGPGGIGSFSTLKKTSPTFGPNKKNKTHPSKIDLCIPNKVSTTDKVRTWHSPTTSGLPYGDIHITAISKQGCLSQEHNHPSHSFGKRLPQPESKTPGPAAYHAVPSTMTAPVSSWGSPYRCTAEFAYTLTHYLIRL